jgi:hypothetical protein
MDPSRRMWLVSIAVGVGLGIFSLLADGVIGGRLVGILGNIAARGGWRRSSSGGSRRRRSVVRSPEL